MSELKLGFYISLLIHLVLLIFFMIFKVSLLPDIIPQQINILDFRMEHVRSGKNNELNPTQKAGEKVRNEFEKGKKNNIIPKKVKLPDSYLAQENPLEQFEIPKKKEVAVNQLKLNEDIGNSFDNVSGKLAQKSLFNKDETIADEPSEMSSEEYLKSLSNRISDNGKINSPYRLEGDILERKIIKKVVPKYPAGQQKNTEVKIQFDVLKDGSVSNMMVVKKSDPIFDKTSLETLQQWKFNSRPINKKQTGFITFVYRLK